MIGVRSSCDRLSMNSARMRCRRRSSATSSRTSQTPRIGERRARTTSVAPVVAGHVGERHLAAGPARLARPAGDRLDAMVAERLDGRPADHRPRLAPQEHVGRGVGDLDAEVVGQSDDADADQVGEVGKVAEALLEPELGALGPAAKTPEPVGQVLAVDRVGAPSTPGAASLRFAQRLVDGLERPAPRPARRRARSRGRWPGARRTR